MRYRVRSRTLKTQVSGNAAGYKISLFSIERVLPVSKSNVAIFRDKIKDLGKGLR